MARILSRPMFRKGGSANSGIMDGLVDRRGYYNGDIVGRAKELATGFAEMYKEMAPPPRDTSMYEMLIGGGLNLVSGRGAGSGLMSNVAESFKEPTQRFFQSSRAAGDYERQLRLKAAGLGITSAMEEAKAKAKAAGSGMQKEYSTRRKYHEFFKEYTEDPKDKYNKTIFKLYPHAMATYASEIQDNAYQTKEGAAVMQQVTGVVPNKIKSGKAEWEYDRMDAGAYYYHPEYKAFVQRIPRTDEDGEVIPEHLIVINPYTFKEIRRVNLG